MNVRLPASQSVHEVRVSLDLKVGEATRTLVHMIAELEHGLYEPSGSERLMLLDGRDKGCLLDPREQLSTFVPNVLVDGIRVAVV